MAKVNIPNKITEDCWFFEDNKEKLTPHLGKPYISYSSISSWEDYRGDFIKGKLAGITLPESIYAAFGSWIGESVEHGKVQPNNYGFTGHENLKLIERKEGTIYERMILIDMGEYCIIGFIDIFLEISPKTVNIADIKTGGSAKEGEYKKDSYIQLILYAQALVEEGYTINAMGVWFCRRTGSHIKPPLHLSTEQFYIPLEFTKGRVKYALDKTNRVVKEISEFYTTFTKFFGDSK